MTRQIERHEGDNMRKITKRALMKAGLAAGLMVGLGVQAQTSDVVKIGLIAPFTGPYALMGQSYKHGVEAFLALKGKKVGKRTVEVIYRDSAGADPTLAKRLAEELIVKDKVSMLIGPYLSPEAAAAAPVINEAQIPMFLPSAATPGLLKLSPFFVRLGSSMNMAADLGASYARQQGKSRGFTAVADYSPGHVVEHAFSNRFKAEGGTIAGNLRIPLSTNDFAPFAERVAAANPDVVSIFLPAGVQSVGFVKAMGARGLTSKLLILGMAEADDSELPGFDDSVLGFNSVMYFDAYAKNPENLALTTWLQKNVDPTETPNAGSIGSYDSMQLAYKVIADAEAAGKPFDGAAAVKSLAGYSFKSPRGPITIDATTREPTMNYYLREVEKGKDGVKRNRVKKVWEDVKVK
jgi:branched-chain amino acid transport system substrate-binding protein